MISLLQCIIFEPISYSEFILGYFSKNCRNFHYLLQIFSHDAFWHVEIRLKFEAIVLSGRISNY